MKSFLVLMSLLVAGLSGCSGCQGNAVTCAVEGAAVSAAASAVASGLQCSNQDAIAASLKVVADKTGMCSAAPKSVLGGVCAQLGGLMVSSLAGGVIPAAWGCTAQNATASLSSLIQQGCNTAFP